MRFDPVFESENTLKFHLAKILYKV